MINTRIAVVAACGISAGVHIALVPEHLDEARALGVAFALAAVVLTGLAAALAYRPAARWPAVGAAVVFAGLLVAYLAVGDSGGALGAVTKVVEAVGIAAALRLLRIPLAAPEPLVPATVFGLCVAFGLMLGAAGHAHG